MNPVSQKHLISPLQFKTQSFFSQVLLLPVRDRQHGCCFLQVTVNCLQLIKELDGTGLYVYKRLQNNLLRHRSNRMLRHMVSGTEYRQHIHPSSVPKDGII